MEQLIDQWLDDYSLALSTIGTLKEEESTSLLESLRSIPPSLSNDRLIDNVLNRNPSLEKDAVTNILELLFAIYDLCKRSELSLDEIIGEIAQKISSEKEISTSIPIDKVEKIRLRLTDLLGSNGTIATSYKAIIILNDHQYVFNDCRVFTDVRPIFGLDTTAKPAGMGIGHLFKIMYVDLNGEKELFISLDTADLEQLGEQIQRAISKEKTLRSMFKDVDIHCL